jgi:hypothetical protein
MTALTDVGIDDADVMRTLEHNGLRTFQASWAALIETLDQTLAAARRGSGSAPDSCACWVTAYSRERSKS